MQWEVLVKIQWEVCNAECTEFWGKIMSMTFKALFMAQLLNPSMLLMDSERSVT
jgi:hypothetical protein